MHLGFRWNKLATHTAAVLMGMLIAWIAMPVWRYSIMELNQQKYGLLVQQCDVAMRDHYQARRSIELREDTEGHAEVAAAELGLLICQDYDLYQKQLLYWGLRENELALMRLKTIEARASDLEEVIDIHEIRY